MVSSMEVNNMRSTGAYGAKAFVIWCIRVALWGVDSAFSVCTLQSSFDFMVSAIPF